MSRRRAAPPYYARRAYVPPTPPRQPLLSRGWVQAVLFGLAACALLLFTAVESPNLWFALHPCAIWRTRTDGQAHPYRYCAVYKEDVPELAGRQGTP